MGFRSTNSSTVKVWAGWSLAHQAWLVAVETSGKLIAVGGFVSTTECMREINVLVSLESQF